MAGRPPKPTKLKELQGNPGKRRLNKGEPQPTRGIPSRPGWLGAEGKREWSRVAPELDQMGLLTLVDRALLAAYCECWDTYVKAIKALRESPELTFTTSKGYVGPRPEIGIAKAMIEKMMQLSARFGFTPSDRSKMSLPEPQEEDEFTQFLKRKAAANE